MRCSAGLGALLHCSEPMRWDISGHRAMAALRPGLTPGKLTLPARFRSKRLTTRSGALA